jgi:hypothetical protein
MGPTGLPFHAELAAHGSPFLRMRELTELVNTKKIINIGNIAIMIG